MTGPYRLEQGGQVDRSQSVPFTFDGKPLSGFAGDTLASALLANGVRTVARSFKFRRPRGIFSCGVEEPNALLQLDIGAHTIPTERASLVPLTNGLEACSLLGWPSVHFDLGRSLDFIAPLWSAGFYNKTFIWPRWRTYEPFIRRMAGLGRSPTEPDPDRYESSNLHCDVLVIGGGVAGLKAALQAAQKGARVVLVEQNHAFGGEAAWSGSAVDDLPAATWLERTIEELNRLPDVRLFASTTATAYYDHNVVTLLERVPQNGGRFLPRERYWIVRTGRVVLATGALEQPLIFCNNDRPGILMAGAAHQYLRRYGVAVGSRVLIATNNDSAYALAKDLCASGVTVLGVADSRSRIPDSLQSSMRACSVEIFPGSLPIDTSGFGALRTVTLARLSRDSSRIDSKQTIASDALAVSGGVTPTLHLFAHAGGRFIYDEAAGALLPAAPHTSIEIVGAAAERSPVGPRIAPVGDSTRQWVDLLHDVTVADVELALRENYTSVEHVKRYTTLGMAADQGKTSALASLDVIGKLRGKASRELGHTTFRPPFMPVTLGAIAGRAVGQRFAPSRRLPLHDWHTKSGALMQDFGEWRRPVVYLRAGESREQAARREAIAVRTAAGIFDASSLGKIEIHGPDALDFLDRLYINDLTTLIPHRVRYVLLLRETGTIFDDGTAVLLAPDHLLVTTTSGNAGRVAQWFEEWHQCEWPHLRVAIIPVTDQWATVSLAGPRARTILSRVANDIDLSAAAFRHLSLLECNLLGSPARIYRVSFTGELTYEINVPADRARTLWDALLKEGEDQGLQPFGMDALMLMRLEKGFLHVGSDTDGTTVPDDVGWGKVAANKKGDYVGKRSLALPNHLRTDRFQLVGLKAAQSFIVGSHLRVQDSNEPTDGWITSAGTTVLSNEHIALAVLRSGRARIGTKVDVYDQGTRKGRALVISPLFYNATGDRMHA